jgi:hypothetical protein
VTTPTWSTLSIATTLAIRTAASRLADEFTCTFGPETIERFLHSSYDQLAQQAAVSKFLPLMAERFVRQRLLAVQKSKNYIAIASRPYCSYAHTTPAGLRWPWIL